MRNGGDEAPKMQAAHRQVGRKDLQRPSYILTRNEGIFRGFGATLLSYTSTTVVPLSENCRTLDSDNEKRILINGCFVTYLALSNGILYVSQTLKKHIQS